MLIQAVQAVRVVAVVDLPAQAVVQHQDKVMQVAVEIVLMMVALLVAVQVRRLQM